MNVALPIQNGTDVDLILVIVKKPKVAALLSDGLCGARFFPVQETAGDILLCMRTVGDEMCGIRLVTAELALRQPATTLARRQMPALTVNEPQLVIVDSAIGRRGKKAIGKLLNEAKMPFVERPVGSVDPQMTKQDDRLLRKLFRRVAYLGSASLQLFAAAKVAHHDDESVISGLATVAQAAIRPKGYGESALQIAIRANEIGGLESLGL